MPRKTYELEATEFQHRFHPQQPANTVWGWGGTAPGRTIMARYGEPISYLRPDERGAAVEAADHRPHW
ncbi:hypothetical protein WME91_30440 [Sorangium sp. So ce269]